MFSGQGAAVPVVLLSDLCQLAKPVLAALLNLANLASRLR